MAKFELSTTDSAWGHESHSPREFFDMCEGLSRIVQNDQTRHPSATTTSALRKETILIPDNQADTFEVAFGAIPGVTSLRRLA